MLAGLERYYVAANDEVLNVRTRKARLVFLNDLFKIDVLAMSYDFFLELGLASLLLEDLKDGAWSLVDAAETVDQIEALLWSGKVWDGWSAGKELEIIANNI